NTKNQCCGAGAIYETSRLCEKDQEKDCSPGNKHDEPDCTSDSASVAFGTERNEHADGAQSLEVEEQHDHSAHEELNEDHLIFITHVKLFPENGHGSAKDEVHEEEKEKQSSEPIS